MGGLAIWFIFELIGVGAAPDLSETQAFKNVSLQMMIDKTFTYGRIFCKKLHHIQVLDVRYEWPKWKRYPFTVSSFRKNLTLSPLPLPHLWSRITESKSQSNTITLTLDTPTDFAFSPRLVKYVPKITKVCFSGSSKTQKLKNSSYLRKVRIFKVPL